MSEYTPVADRPFAHQRQAVKRLLASDGVYALFMEPGTGKSRCVVDYLGTIACAAGQQVRVLILAPRSVLDTWPLQFKLWMGSDVPVETVILEGSITEKGDQLASLKSDAQVLVALVNYEALSSRRPVAKGRAKLHSDHMLESVLKFNPHVRVCDESARLKSSSGNASRLVARIAKHVKRRVLLTGTPMPHSPLDLWAQAKILDDTLFQESGKPMSYGRFMERIAIRGGYMNKEIRGWRNLDWVEDRIALRSMAVKKVECLDLPPVLHSVEPYRLSPRERRAYDKARQDMAVRLESGEVMTAPSMLVLRLRLRQITCGFIQPDDADMEVLGTSRQDAALERICGLVEDGEKRIVVFAWSVHEIQEMTRRLNESGCLGAGRAEMIVGSTDDADRFRLRQEFAAVDSSPEPLVLVAQLRTISLGVNELVSASHAIYLSLSEQRDDLVQSIARLDRQGQTKPVTLHYIVAQDTVDEVILKAHQLKERLESKILEHVRSGSGPGAHSA